MNLLRYLALAVFRATTVLCALVCDATASPQNNLRITTWNLEWFPNGSSKEASAQEQIRRIRAAADVLRSLNSDILLLQEVRDYDVCEKLADVIKPGVYQVAICSAFKGASGVGKQQLAILAKSSALAAWAEPWKSTQGVSPPRGFAFAWFRIGGADVGVYSLHLKSNLVMRGDKKTESVKNTKKREVAAEQLLGHMQDVIAIAMPMVRTVIVGGDFNTNPDKFASETTLTKLSANGFHSCMEGLPLNQRVTCPGKAEYPDTTFDYLLIKNGLLTRPEITKATVSDHYPVTCDVTLPAAIPRDVAALAESGQTRNDQSALADVPTLPSNVRITRETKIQIPYGTIRIPIGTSVKVQSRRGQTVIVEYLDGTYEIPTTNTESVK